MIPVGIVGRKKTASTSFPCTWTGSRVTAAWPGSGTNRPLCLFASRSRSRWTCLRSRLPGLVTACSMASLNHPSTHSFEGNSHLLFSVFKTSSTAVEYSLLSV